MNSAEKRCGCTGLRWCAYCLDPAFRERHRMDPPMPTPAWLVGGLQQQAAPPPGICFFDPGQQAAPGCDAFRGCQVIPDFVDEAEAAALLQEIEARPFVPSQSGKGKQHYGPKINFKKQKMNPDPFKGLPPYAPWLEARLRERVSQGLLRGCADEGLFEAALAAYETTDAFVQHYDPLQRSNLDFHVDDTFAYGELILDLSLASDTWLSCVRGREAVRVRMPARSLTMLCGPARFEWEHGIFDFDIEGPRVSITLRTLSPGLRESEGGHVVIERARASSRERPFRNAPS